GGDRAVWERRWRAAAGRAGDGPGPAVKPAQQAPEPRLRAAAVRALLPVPAQLPMEPRPLAGRGRELGEARALTAAGTGPVPPLVVHGPTGVGKSALALRLAHELAADLPDGQLYVGLGAAADGRKDAPGIAGGMLRSLGIAPELIPDDPAQRIGLYRSVLYERRLLVVLDGALQERQVRDLLVAAPHSRIVVTARSRLLGLDGVRRLALPVLGRDESMDLLAGIVGAERLAGAPRAGLLLAEACGDLPLALTLAGRRLAARPEAFLAEAVAELVAADGLSGRLRVGDESLTERYEDAYRRLTPPARLLLHRFAATGAAPAVDGVIRTPATALAHAPELPREPAETVEDVLETVVDSGLLERTDVPGQYGLPPLVRQFALARAAATADGPEPVWHRPRSDRPAPGAAHPFPAMTQETPA
ncbi:NB-ARC domain-containing protein, partial [Streptomyces olivaceoviridis]